MIKVAIPLFGLEVAPRFSFAGEVLVATVEGDGVRSRQRFAMEGLSWHERIRLLAGQGVTLILAGGFNRRLLPMAKGSGIEVIWGLGGEAETLLGQLCRGELAPKDMEQ